jgi:ferric-dicitrate binding protein FerR (iron transport regulator)
MNEQYDELVRRFLDNKASEEELTVFFDLLEKGEIDVHLDAALLAEERRARAGESEKSDERLSSDGELARASRRIRWMPRRLAAASIVIAVLAGGLWYVGKKASIMPLTGVPDLQYTNDRQPGRNHAVLTLATGKVIDLDSNAAGTVALPAGARLIKNGKGEWMYHSGNNNDVTVYNTISAPRGGQFAFVLEDGTKVWLNASSSMRFPTVFRGKARTVDLEGEAYLEVAENPHMPFIVQTGEMQIRVLGTHFNINAYPDEAAVRTTLLEGAVEVAKGASTVLLRPGEQASCKADGAINTVKDPEVVDAAMAWRSGYFSFNEDNIQTVMRQIARWYDVQIRYEGPVTKTSFGGDIGRDLTLVQVLRVLEKSQVHFKLDENVLTILP